jgi:DNA-directed RNA polymerase subunit RPC12/RpoP
LGRCGSCGTNYFLFSDFDQCGWCGKDVCEACSPEWHSGFEVKNKMDKDELDFVGFCSQKCEQDFIKTVLDYPIPSVGTDTDNFTVKIRKLYYKAVLNALKKEPEIRAEAIRKVETAIELETDDYVGIVMGLEIDGTLSDEYEVAHDFIKKCYQSLSENLEKCGRYSDSAKIFETKLNEYEKARQLRDLEHSRQMLVKHTNISVNLNELLDQVHLGGIAVVYKCPNCGGNLKIDQNTRIDQLTNCEYCHTNIERRDLAELIRTALS